MIRRPPGSKRTDNTLSLHDALPIFAVARPRPYVRRNPTARLGPRLRSPGRGPVVAQDPAHPQTLLGPALLWQWILLNQVRQHHRRHRQIGGASCRERVCPYVYLSMAAVSLKQKNYLYQASTTLILHTQY